MSLSFAIDDTVVALATAAGPGARSVIRLSGPQALQIALGSFSGPAAGLQDRGIREGTLRVSGIMAPVPAMLAHFPGPRSYTGQNVVELHVISSVPLVEQLLSDLMIAGARAARPGEFTLRAFLAGKLDLPRAEAVLGVIEAGDRDELRHALRQLAGGVSRPLEGLRDDLLNLLADLEAGLDFADEDIAFVDKPELLTRISRGLAAVTLVQKQVQERAIAGKPFRVVLAGPPNSGKSRLFNALTGADALVSPQAGTTRDYLIANLDVNGTIIELVDTAGLRNAADAIEKQAQELGQSTTADADLVAWCSELGQQPPTLTDAAVVRIATKCDLGPAVKGTIPTSAATGTGLDTVKGLLASKARSKNSRGLAPSLSRCRHHVDACLDALRRSHHGVLFDEPPDVVALDLRAALEHLGAMTGAVYTDDLLDRIFSRFCIGK